MVWRMSKLTRDGTRHTKLTGTNGDREKFKFHFPLCSADHEQDWQPYPVDAQSAESDDTHTHAPSGQELSTKVVMNVRQVGIFFLLLNVISLKAWALQSYVRTHAHTTLV